MGRSQKKHCKGIGRRTLICRRMIDHALLFESPHLAVVTVDLKSLAASLSRDYQSGRTTWDSVFASAISQYHLSNPRAPALVLNSIRVMSFPLPLPSPTEPLRRRRSWPVRRPTSSASPFEVNRLLAMGLCQPGPSHFGPSPTGHERQRKSWPSPLQTAFASFQSPVVVPDGEHFAPCPRLNHQNHSTPTPTG